MKKLIGLGVLLIFCIVANGQGKIGELKARTKSKIDERIDRKVGELIDGELNKIENRLRQQPKATNETATEQTETESQNSNPNVENFDISAMFGGGAKVDIPASYTFQSDVTFEVKSQEKNRSKNAETLYYQYFFSEKESYFGMKPESEELKAQNMFMVMQDLQMISFFEQSGSKFATVMSFENVTETVTTTETDETPAKIIKTGKTKQILGYTCEEYLQEDEETKSSIWIADVSGGFNFAKIFAAMQQSSLKRLEQPQGFVMEINSLDKQSGDVFSMIATEFNPHKTTTFSTAGYQQMNVGNLFGGQKN